MNNTITFPKNLGPDASRAHLWLAYRACLSSHEETLRKYEELEGKNKEILNTIQYSLECDCPIEFLQCWVEGDFESIRREWPEFKGYAGEGEQQDDE